jgi:molecular chaperone HscB
MFDSSKNYFDLFGLPQGFRIDTAELVVRYRELQKVVHPDRFATADATSRRLSLQQATLVNEAFQTLKDPLRRAQYLLALRGVDGGRQDGTLADPGFLMQQMALRESLEAVRTAGDPHARLEALLAEIDGLLRGQVAELATLLEGHAADDLDAAAAAVQKMQFLVKLQAEAEAVEAHLEELG